MNIFICRTIFQVYYAKTIITEKKIEDVFFVYLAEEMNEREFFVLEKYIGEYNVIDGNGQLLRLLRQVKLLLLLKKIFKKNYGDLNLFFSSIDDLFIQTILSLFDFNNIYTFDDGTANYINNSIFFIDQKPGFKIRFKYKLMGNKIKGIDEVKAKIKKHYSSNNLPNIIAKERVEYLPLAEFSVKDSNTNHLNYSAINVYLCPNFDEVYVDPDKVRKRFISSLNHKDILIPHPRDNYCWKNNSSYVLYENTIAEAIVHDLIIKGYHVNLFGIANSTQYHYLNNSCVSNILLDIGTVKPCIASIIKQQVELFKCLANTGS